MFLLSRHNFCFLNHILTIFLMLTHSVYSLESILFLGIHCLPGLICTGGFTVDPWCFVFIGISSCLALFFCILCFCCRLRFFLEFSLTKSLSLLQFLYDGYRLGLVLNVILGITVISLLVCLTLYVFLDFILN